MKKVTAIILCLTLIFPMTVFANPPESESEISDPPPTVLRPRIMGIQEGDFTEKNYSNEECRLRITYEVEREIARVNLLLESTRVSMESVEKRYTSIISIKNTEIERLSEIASNNNDYSVWWATGGIVMGIGLTLAVVYGVKNM